MDHVLRREFKLFVLKGVLVVATFSHYYLYNIYSTEVEGSACILLIAMY